MGVLMHLPGLEVLGAAEMESSIHPARAGAQELQTPVVVAAAALLKTTLFRGALAVPAL